MFWGWEREKGENFFFIKMVQKENESVSRGIQVPTLKLLLTQS